jgi:serine/threonine protein kinase
MRRWWLGILVAGLRAATTSEPTADDSIAPRAELLMSQSLLTVYKETLAVSSKRSGFIDANDHEDIPGIGRVQLEPDPLARGLYSTVFGSTSHKDLIFKFQTNCDELRSQMHPLVLDFIVSERASEVDAAFRPIYLSGPRAFPDSRSPKTNFRIPDEKWEECKAKGATVRFLVTHRAGICLNDLHVSIPLRIKTGVHLGAQLVSLLERLHAANLVHGDIHLANICLDKDMELKLIDFGKANSVDWEMDVPWYSNMSYVHPLHSPWQMQGFTEARRDDMYRAVFAIADFIVDRKNLIVRAIALAITNPLELFRWKMEDFLFAPLEAMTRSAAAHLETVLSLVRSLKSVATPIPYSDLFSNFTAVIPLV